MRELRTALGWRLDPITKGARMRPMLEGIYDNRMARMTALEAHKRLLGLLAASIREHRIKDDVADKPHRPGTVRKVMIGGRTYHTVAAASRSLRVSAHTIYRMIDDGRARYA